MGESGEFSELRLKGVVDSPSWELAKERVLESVFKFSSLLSVIFDCEVRISNGPNEDAHHQETEIVEQRDISWEAKYFPTGILSKWDELVTREWLFDSIKSYSQAKLTELDNPSFSFLAYIACIENIGQRLLPLSACGESLSDGKVCPVKKGAERAFIRALQLIVSPDDARRLSNSIYKPRSTFVHRATFLADDGKMDSPILARSFSHDPNRKFDLEKDVQSFR